MGLNTAKAMPSSTHCPNPHRTGGFATGLALIYACVCVRVCVCVWSGSDSSCCGQTRGAGGSGEGGRLVVMGTNQVSQEMVVSPFLPLFSTLSLPFYPNPLSTPSFLCILSYTHSFSLPLPLSLSLSLHDFHILYISLSLLFSQVKRTAVWFF